MLDEKAESESPSGNRVREVLELMLEISKRFAPQDAPETTTDGEAAGGTSTAAGSPGAVTGRVLLPSGSRAPRLMRAASTLRNARFNS